MFEKKCKEYKIKLRSKKADAIRVYLTNNKNDPKKLWRCLKGLYEDKENSIQKVIFNGICVVEPLMIANILNKFFVESVESLIKEIKLPMKNDYLDLINCPNEEFRWKTIRIDELKLTLKELKSKNFIDLISGRTLNDLISDDTLAKKLLVAINDSFENCIIPTKLKCSLVTPIPKVSNAMNPIEYRPVNNLPVYDKVIETLMLNQLKDFIHEEDILSEYQHGFRSKHSCETAVLALVKNWIDVIEKKNIAITIFLDFKRAFETVDREILLLKMQKYNFSAQSISWFKDYLSNRHQKTIVNGMISDEVEVNIGVPQGSKLSNLLFILYINDIVKLSGDADFVLYADDTCITVNAPSVNEAYSKMSKLLNDLEDWLYFNKIILNVSKCKFMIINNKENEDVKISMCNEIVEKVEIIKYLGIIVDNKLKFGNHCDDIAKKFMKKFGFLWRNQRKMDFKSKVLYYKTLILPHINNCSSILMMCDKGKIDEIEKAHKRIIRFITNSQENIDLVYEKLNTVSIKTRISINNMKLIKQIDDSKVPEILANNFNRVGSLRKFVLRNDDHFNVPNFKSLIGTRSIFFSGLIEYNKMQNVIKAKRIESKNLSFVRICKLYFDKKTD